MIKQIATAQNSIFHKPFPRNAAEVHDLSHHGGVLRGNLHGLGRGHCASDLAITS